MIRSKGGGFGKSVLLWMNGRNWIFRRWLGRSKILASCYLRGRGKSEPTPAPGIHNVGAGAALNFFV